LANLTTVEKPNIARIIFDEGILDFLCYGLNSSKSDVLLVTLEGLYRLLDYGQMYFQTEECKNPVVKMLMKSKYLDKLESMQMNKSQRIFDLANKIIETFFDNENAN
jgi:hypothetical protein